MHCINDELFDLAKKSCEVRPLAGGSRFSFDTDCPEPDYDKDLYDTVNQYPDKSY